MKDNGGDTVALIGTGTDGGKTRVGGYAVMYHIERDTQRSWETYKTVQAR